MKQGQAGCVRSLPLRVRRTLGAAHPQMEETVHCPRRQTSIPAAQCLACVDCGGVRLAGTTLAVLCSHPASLHDPPTPIEGPVSAEVADRVRVTDVMSTDVVCVAADLPIDRLRSILSRDLLWVIVVDGENRPVGMVGRADLWGRRDGLVSDAMAPVRFTLAESSTLTDAIMLITFQGMAQIPIVAGDGTVVGLLEGADVARLVHGRRRANRATG